MEQSIFILDKEAIVDVFSVWKDTFLLAPLDAEEVNYEDVDPKEQADEFLRILKQVQKEED